MADEAINEQAAPQEGQQQDQAQAQVESSAKPKAPKRPKGMEESAPAEVAAPEQPRQDPMMAQLVSAQRELDQTRKELADHKARIKQHERDMRKQSILSALIDEFPGIPRNEIRGAALVAAEDGEVDLYSEDHQAAVDKLKEALRPKSKKSSAATPAASLGGTPGSPSKPPAPNRGKFLL